MSATPTLSVSSGQTRYYDAVVMHFSPLPTGEGQASSSADPRVDHLSAASESLGGMNQPYQTEETGLHSMQAKDEAGQKAPSLRSLPTEPDDQEQRPAGMKTYNGTGNTLARKASVRTTGSTHTTASAFTNGAPLTGPNAEPDVDDAIVARGANAERSLSQKQKDRITRKERKESKKFSRLLKTESTTEQVALDSALKTLSSLQGLHKAAIRREAKAETSYAKALSAAQEAEGKFHEEKARATEMHARAETRCKQEHARWEGKEGEVRAQQERLDSAKESVKETEMRITECAREVERLRVVKATDEREREVKLAEMTRQK